MPTTKEISKITVPISSTASETYYFKDAEGRSELASLTTNIMRFVGYTTTPLTDGSTTQKITVNSKEYTAKSGDVVIYDPNGSTALNEQEFIWDGSAWREFGSTTNLGTLAFKNSASGTLSCTIPSGTATNALKYDKLTSASINIPKTFTLGGNTARAVTVENASWTYQAPVRSTDAKYIIKATATGGGITGKGTPITVPKSVKLTGGTKVIDDVTITNKYATTASIRGVQDTTTTASKCTSVGSVTAGTDAELVQGTLPTMIFSEDASDSENLIISFDRGTKTALKDGTGKATVVTLPTYSPVDVPIINTAATNIIDNIVSSKTGITGDYYEITSGVTTTKNTTAYTSVAIDQSAQVYSDYEWTAPTVALSDVYNASTHATAQTGELLIAAQQWTTNATASGDIDINATVAVPTTISVATNASAPVTLTTTPTAPTGTLTVNTTTETHTVTVS